MSNVLQFKKKKGYKNLPLGNFLFFTPLCHQSQTPGIVLCKYFSSRIIFARKDEASVGIKEMLENTDLKFRRGLCWKKGFRAVGWNWSEDCWWNFSPQVSDLGLLQSCLARESAHSFTTYTACPEDSGIPSSRKLLDILNLLFACS